MRTQLLPLLFIPSLALGLRAQSHSPFRELAPEANVCPKASDSAAAHSEFTSFKDAAADQVIPKGQRQSVADFGVLDAQGGLTRIADLKGQVVVLTFWSATCSPSLQQVEELRRLKAAATQHQIPLSVVAVNVESWPQALAFVRSKGPNFEGIKVAKPALAPHGLSLLGGEIQAMPTALVVDRDGGLAARWEGCREGRLLSHINELAAER